MNLPLCSHWHVMLREALETNQKERYDTKNEISDVGIPDPLHLHGDVINV